MPYYAVIFKKSKMGIISCDWDTARGLRDADVNSCIKKFSTETDAKNCITGLKCKIVSSGIKRSASNIKKKKSLKTAEIQSLEKPINSVKTALNDLQEAVTSISRFSLPCVTQLRNLNNEVCGKLDEIFNLIEVQSKCISLPILESPSFVNETLPLSDQQNLFSTNIDGIDGNFLSSELETGKKLFHLNGNYEVIVFTDGACSNNGKNRASAGAGIWFGNCHPLNLSVKVPGVQTNNNAEIYSVIKAIDIVKATGLSKINIHTDSEFVIKSVNEWMPRWEVNGWKTFSGTEVKNKEMFMLLQKKLKSMKSVGWTYVRGHQGITGNEEADKLARMGAKI